jgi:hypothetical protein
MPQPLTWSTSLTWDTTTPGITWDGSVQTPPVRKKKPFRRSHQPKPDTTMPTFKYHVAPKTGGGFTTRVVKGTAADQTAIVAALAAQVGITPQQTTDAITGFLQKVLQSSASCEWSPEMFGLITFRPTSGGTSPLPDGFHNADDINADVSLSFSAETIRQWRATLSLESMGEVGKITPEIDSIIRQSDMAEDKYTPGGLIELRGDNLKLTPADLAQGVFFTPTTGATVRATEYAAILPQSIIVLVPASLSGALEVRISSYINGSVRNYTYTNTITTP